MTTATLESIMYSFMGLGVLLLLGIFIRAKVALFRRLLIPASIIGGILGMILNPSILGRTGINIFPSEWIEIWSLLPGILVLPIFASLPLCNFKDKDAVSMSSLPRRKLYSVLICGFLRCPTWGLQIFFGVGVGMLLKGIFSNLFMYPCFGCEMAFGYNGSHSLAAVLGSLMKEAGHDYWELSQSIGQAYATIGLIGGIVMGIFFINRAIRKGETQIITSSQTLSDNLTYGFYRNIEEQGSIGRETTEVSNAHTVTIHIALVLIVCFLGYNVRMFIRQIGLGFLGDIPAYIWAMMLAYPVNAIMNKLDLGWLFDRKTKQVVSGVCTDFVILSALASIDVGIIVTYLAPIIIISAIGFIISYLMTFAAYKHFMPGDYPFERAIGTWGTNTGFAATELALLQIVDPGFKSTVLSDLNLAGVMFNLKDLVFLPFHLAFITSGQPVKLMITAAIEVSVMYFGASIVKFLDNKERRKEEAAL